MNKKAILIGAVMILVVVAGYVFSQYSVTGNTIQEGQKTKISVLLSWFINSLHAGFFEADDLGFYDKAGLDVTNNPGGPDFPAINLIISGSDDFGLISGIDPLLIARSKGVPIKAIAVLHQKDPNVFLSLKESDITSPKDFENKKVGIWYGHPTESYYRGMMESAEVDTSNIEEVPIKFDVMPLLTGQIDIMPGFVVNHLLLIQEKGYEANVIEPSDYGVNSYGFTIFATEEMIEEKPELVKAFLTATLKGYEWALENPKEAVEIVTEYNPSIKENYDHQFNQLILNIEHFKPQENSKIGCMKDGVWKESYERLIEQGLIEKQFDYQDTYTNKFIRSFC